MEEKDIIEENVNQEEEMVTVPKSVIEQANQALNETADALKKSNDNYLRALADYQNLKRISDGIIAKSKDNGKIEIIKALLPIIDDFEKAKESEELSEGVSFIYDKFINMLTNNGVEIINPNQSDEFNDSLHEAVCPVARPTEEFMKNTIVFTQQKGYKMGSTIIRYAKVGVYV